MSREKIVDYYSPAHASATFRQIAEEEYDESLDEISDIDLAHVALYALQNRTWRLWENDEVFAARLIAEEIKHRDSNTDFIARMDANVSGACSIAMRTFLDEHEFRMAACCLDLPPDKAIKIVDGNIYFVMYDESGKKMEIERKLDIIVCASHRKSVDNQVFPLFLAPTRYKRDDEELLFLLDINYCLGIYGSSVDEKDLPDLIKAVENNNVVYVFDFNEGFTEETEEVLLNCDKSESEMLMEIYLSHVKNLVETRKLRESVKSEIPRRLKNPM